MTDTRQSIRDHKTILGRVVIATTLAALVFLTGCDGAGTPMEQEQPPPPTLIGTWQTVHTYPNEDGEIGMTTITLTFTKSRFIEFNLREEESGDTYYWANSGTYTRTDTTVTKIYHNWIDELEDYNDEPIEVLKDYLWGDVERSTLLVHDWGNDDPSTTFERYARIDGPDPSEIVGTWVRRDSWEHDERLGEVERTVTYTITTDDTFTETVHRAYESGDAEMFTLSGNLTIDEDNQILKVAVTSASEEWNDEPQEGFPESEFVGHELSYGYTGVGQPDKLSFSPRWAEQDWNDETMMYEEDKEYPYGYYHWLFTRQ